MDDDKKVNYDLFFRVLFVLFIMFLCVYMILISGFVEIESKNNTLYTEEQIKKFEEDVKNGKEIDLNVYLERSEIDYSNKISDVGGYISEAIGEGAKYSIEYLEKIFKFMFE